MPDDETVLGISSVGYRFIDGESVAPWNKRMRNGRRESISRRIVEETEERRMTWRKDGEREGGPSFVVSFNSANMRNLGFRERLR